MLALTYFLLSHSFYTILIAVFARHIHARSACNTISDERCLRRTLCQTTALHSERCGVLVERCGVELEGAASRLKLEITHEELESLFGRYLRDGVVCRRKLGRCLTHALWYLR
ncbi:hypothetical protein BDV97DRAFT_178492 [Delphinella strobiligena]|nr:hypothetical protein BDV97DRAFT_178492 [Delphinella strobiligena]